MAIELQRPVLTLEEFMALQASEANVRGYEYEDGRLIPMPPVYVPQSSAWGDLFAVLHQHVRQHGLGKVLLDVVLYLDPKGRRRYFPDIVYLASDRLHQIQGKIIVGPPTLVIEVTTEDSQERDRMQKLKAYHKARVPWYWIADVEMRQIEEYRWTEGGYERVSASPFDGPFTPQLFPELTLTGIGA